MGDVEVLRDGTMLLSDDMNGLIYRIEYIGSEDGKAGPNNGPVIDALAGAVHTQPLWWMACSALAGGAVTVALVMMVRLCGRRQPASLLTKPIDLEYTGKDAL